MKCFYYVTPTLDSTHSISDDLQDLGIGEWMVHVVTKDEAGNEFEQTVTFDYEKPKPVVYEPPKDEPREEPKPAPQRP